MSLFQIHLSEIILSKLTRYRHPSPQEDSEEGVNENAYDRKSIIVNLFTAPGNSINLLSIVLLCEVMLFELHVAVNL